MADASNSFRTTYGVGSDRKLDTANAYQNFKYTPSEPPSSIRYSSNHSKPRTSTSSKYSSSPSSSSSWGLNDAELKRKRRVAGYKAYAVEGKMKASFRKGFRWIKDRCSEIVHGY